jgi:hypothetical protein
VLALQARLPHGLTVTLIHGDVQWWTQTVSWQFFNLRLSEREQVEGRQKKERESGGS